MKETLIGSQILVIPIEISLELLLIASIFDITENVEVTTPELYD